MPLAGFPRGSADKESAYNAIELSSILGLERSPGKENGKPLQYSCLENSMERGAWQAKVCGVPKSQTWLSNWLHTAHMFLAATVRSVSLNLIRLCNSMGSSQPDSPVHGTFQAEILEWVAISFYMGSSWPRDRTYISHIVGRIFMVWAT